MIARVVPCVLCLASALGCGGSSDGAGSGGAAGADAGHDAGGDTHDCVSVAGAYAVTTQIVSAPDCAVSVGRKTAATYTFTQTAPSCAFTMTNSVYPESRYEGVLTMQGAQVDVTWTTVVPAPLAGGYALTYTSEHLTITPASGATTASLSGSFDWSTSACSGTTNVCNGSVASCTTPG